MLGCSQGNRAKSMKFTVRPVVVSCYLTELKSRSNAVPLDNFAYVIKVWLVVI